MPTTTTTTTTTAMEAQEQEAKAVFVQLEESLNIEEDGSVSSETTDHERDNQHGDGGDCDESLPSLDEVEDILNYKFNDRRLLEEAFTDSSYPEKSFSYERLEYMGDSVLNVLFTKEQYFTYPDLAPGALTRLRSANVNTEKLARVAVKLGLHSYLRHNKPLLGEQIREFSAEILDYPLLSNGLVEAPKVLADIVESSIGAVFIDSNFSIDTVWKVFRPLLEPIISMETLKVHPVTELYEFCQKKNLKVKFIDMWHESNTFHVFVEEKLVGVGSYSSKKEIAQHRAAENALKNLLLDHTLVVEPPDLI